MKKETNRQVLKTIKQSLRNPFVIISLVLGVLGAPPLWFSGIYLGQGQAGIAGLLFLIYVVIYSFDALVVLTLLINRGENEQWRSSQTNGENNDEREYGGIEAAPRSNDFARSALVSP